MSHTPGPWTWNPARTVLSGPPPDGQVLALDLPEFMTDGDKDLIAAAPALLTAAKAAYVALPRATHIAAINAALCAALAKAEGRTP